MYRANSIVVIISIILLLSGCSSQGIPIGDGDGNYPYHFDASSDQLNFIKTTGAQPSMIATESGYYFTGGITSLKFLYYTDKTTFQTTILCNKPDCLHIHEPNHEKRRYCNANISGKTASLLYYNSYIYYYRAIHEKDKPLQFLLTRISLDGTQRKDVFTFKDYPQYTIIHRGYLYYTVAIWGSDTEDGISDFDKYTLYRVPMDDLGKTPEVLYEISGFQATIGIPMGYGTGIYFYSSVYTDSDMEEKKSQLLRYDIETGEISTIIDGAGAFAICAGKIVYFVDDDHMVICDLDGSNKRTLRGILGIVHCDDRYILSDTIFMNAIGKKDELGNSIKSCLYVHDLSGKILQAFNLDDYGSVSIFGSDSNYIFLTSSLHKNEYENIVEYWRIDKSKIADGSAKLEKYYSITLNTKP